MDRGQRLGAHAYAEVGVLPGWELSQGCGFSVVRREGDGRRCLLQLWEPRPAERVLDTLRAEFLARFSQAEAMDTGPSHFGFDAERVWFLQELAGTPLLRLWAETDGAGRADLKTRLLALSSVSKVPRLLWPEVVGLRPGRILAPRVLGERVPDPAFCLGALDEVELPEADQPGPRPWEDPPDLADTTGVPTRGRALELTYLKSLMFGLSSPIPMERVALLLGEVGLGHERLCDWAAAAAETEGIWVSNLEAHPYESAGAFLERLVQDLISGLEAELYAELPTVARALSRRMATFAFLHGGRRTDASERRLEATEVDAAVLAMAFAQARHPRLVLLRRLEQAAPEVHELVRDLVQATKLAWLLSSRGHGQAEGLKSCTTALRNHPEAGTMVLDRLEDEHLVAVLGDLLGAHELPAPLVRELCTACLGNPGLMQRFLELAQASGALVHQRGRWIHPPEVPFKVEMQQDMVQGVLAGRLLRLNGAALALVRYLALADMPLALHTLGRAMGVDADAAEEALRTAVSAKLAEGLDAGGSIASAQVRDLALAKMPPNEVVRCARVLLKVLEEEGGKPGLSVRLQSFALDPATALSQVIHAINVEFPGPLVARRIVDEALKLMPSPRQEARLWEFLSDNLGSTLEMDRLSSHGAKGRSPFDLALEALNRAIEALGDGSAAGEPDPQGARLQRKKGQLELRLRRFAAAAISLGESTRLLADHPFHPEQPRLSLAVGRLHLAQGQGSKGIRAFEEGLRLLAQKPAVEHVDQVDLLLELGHAQGQRAFFQGALETLLNAKRLLEHSGDRRRLVGALSHLGMVYQGMGQTDAAGECLKEAFGLARLLDDVELLASCQLQMGIYRSCQQFTGAALAHLDSAYQGFATLGDQGMATQAQAWKARTLAVLGDPVLAELLLFQASAVPPETLTPMEKGDRVMLEGEIAACKEAWGDARRHFQAAANRFAESGLSWRERMARIKLIQAEARGPAGPEALKSAWIRLEGLKGPVEASGSRWLELEWHRAHALVLCQSGSDEGVIAGALQAWGEVLTGAREMKFPALALEASARCTQLLLDRGERLGARSRAQDAAAAFLEIWAKVPGSHEQSFLGRRDIQAFRATAEKAGMPFSLPERTEPLADWSPTQVNLPLVPSS